MHKPHWLFIDTAQAFGGHEVMLLRWMAEMRRQARITPVLIARANTRLYEQAPSGVLAMPLHGIETAADMQGPSGIRHFSRFFTRIAVIYLNIYRLARYVLRLRPALVIVAEGTLLSSAWVTVLLRLLAIKTVIYVPLTQSGTEMGFGRGALRDWLVRKIYRHLPHAWITLTAEQAENFPGWSQIRQPVFVLPNTVAPEIEAAMLARINNPDLLVQPVSKPLRVLILGRLDAHQKNLDTLLNFLCLRIGLSTDFHFTFAGDGPYGAEIDRRLSVFPALRKLVSLRKWSATVDVMREHDVLLLPSRYEGVPLVMLEAMALGLPVIATSLPGTRALLKPDCLFSTGNYEHAMQLLHSVKQDTKRIGLIERNREIFMEQASSAMFARAVDTLTNRLINLVNAVPDTDTQPDDVTVIRT
ncbi:MAG: glycosyltransferase [Steroidobacter sp.]